MGEIEIDKCDICGKEAQLDRTYFYYNIPCECCGCKIDNKDMHFVMVRHCNKCTPDIPIDIKVLQQGMNGTSKYVLIHKMIPYSIRGNFIINHNLMTD